MDAERAVAFQEAQRKFAMYGKQNAHVSHLASGRKAAASSARGDSDDTAVKPMRKRAMLMASTVAGGEDDAMVLKNTLLLQENGELALHLDDFNYHLDGVVANCGLDTDANSKSMSEQLYAGAQNVVELARLLQLEQVQLVLKLASPGQNLYARIRKVMSLLLLPASSGGDRGREDLLQLAVAVMALFLTQSADADELFTSDSLNLIVQSLAKLGNDGRAVAERDGMHQVAEGRAPAVTLKTDQLMPLKKTCLKRKAGSLNRARSSSISSGDDTGEQQLSDAASDSHDGQLFAKIKGMLESQEMFCVEGRLLQKVSTADVLVVVLHNLLQMDKRQGQQHTQTGRSYYNRGQRDLAGATFSVVLARKRQLIGNRGLDTLILSLVKQFQHLKTLFLRADTSLSVTTSPAFQHACSLRRVQAVLRVLDQASFLATEVQQYLSNKAVLFKILLESIDELSELCWGSRQASSTWLSSSDSAWLHHLVAEVFLVSMRVLINLTHHNKDAARQIHSLRGTTILFRAFCKLWGFVVEASKRSASDGEAGEAGTTVVFEEKLLFDALLMCLSALTNCVEFSEENRESLSSLPAPSDGISGLQAFKTADACELLTHFFLSKVQSYLRLIEMSESQSGSSQVATIESEESHQWVPEDVVLGGCTSLLLGCLMKDSVSASSAVLAMLPDGSPRLLLRALSAFVALHSQIGALTPEVGDSVLQVEQTLKSFLSEQETGYSATSTAPSTPLQTVKITISVESGDRSRGGHQQSSQDADSQPRIDETLSRSEEKEVTTPPAAAFKLQRWKKVCASVDSDSESGDGDAARTQKEAPMLLARSPNARSPKKLKSQSPVVRSPNVKRPKKEKASRKSPSTCSPAAALLASSATRPTRRDGASQVQVSPQRVKRTRELVSELAAKLSKVSDDGSSFNAFSAVVTSTVDSSKQQHNNDDWDLDFSKDNQPPLKKKTGRATPPIRIRSRDSSPMTPGARKRARIGKLPYRSPNRSKLAVALTAISLPQQVTLEDASKMPERVSSTTEVSMERESSLEIALKRKQKAAKPLPSTTTTEAAAVFDFLD